jgi:hypothetical protein
MRYDYITAVPVQGQQPSRGKHMPEGPLAPTEQEALEAHRAQQKKQEEKARAA